MDSQQEDRGLTKEHLQGWSLARKPHQGDDGLIQGTFGERRAGADNTPAWGEPGPFPSYLLNQMASPALT